MVAMPTPEPGLPPLRSTSVAGLAIGGAPPTPGALASMADLDGSQTPQQQRSVKRPRPVKSCTECRKRKLRCDRLCPCSQCQKSHRVCKYSPDNDSSNMSDVSDGETADLSRPNKRNCLPPTLGSLRSNSTEVSATLAAKYGDGPMVSLVEELVSRLERLERSAMARSDGGTDLSVPRSQRSQRNIASPSTVRGLTIKKGAARTRYFGQSSPRVMLNLVSVPTSPPVADLAPDVDPSSTRPRTSWLDMLGPTAFGSCFSTCSIYTAACRTITESPCSQFHFL